MTTAQPTRNQLSTLRREAAEHGDLEQEALCVLALGGRDELADAEPGTAWAELYASGMTQEQAIDACGQVLAAVSAQDER